MYYEGFISLFDQGYNKSIYVNTFVPHSKAGKPFYMSTMNHEAWIMLLIKALAKYYGSYDNLRQLKMNDICTTLLGSAPFAINNELKRQYKLRHPISLEILAHDDQSSELFKLYEKVYLAN